MQANTKVNAPLTQSVQFEIVLNFCRTVIRSDEQLLRDAMCQYHHSLAAPLHRKAA